MNRHKKQLVALLLSLTIFFSNATPAFAVKYYDANAALSYAQEHWNDGKGLCAEFVSNCLNAGGCTIWSSGCTTMVKLLRKSDYGTWEQLTFENNGRISVFKNSEKLSIGDPVFFYCPNETDGCPYVHVILYSGQDSKGYLKGYAHNRAKNNEVIQYEYCGYCNSRISAAYVYHMNQSSSNTNPSAPSPTPLPSSSVKTDGYYTIRNLGSGKMLNVYGNGKTNGTNVTVYSADNTSGQDFKFIANGDETYVLQPKCATSSALNVHGFSAEANSQVDIWTKSGHSTQSWIVEYNSSLNGYVIRSANNSSYVLAATGSKDSSDVRLAAYNASDKYQIWTSSAFPDNSAPAKNPATLTFAPNTISLNLTDKKSQAVTLTIGGDLPEGSQLIPSFSTRDIVTIDWGGNTIGMTSKPIITAKTAGNTTLTCSVVDKATGTTRATAQLKITVAAANYTVRYDANGGINAPASQTKTAQRELTLTSDCPECEGFTFAGWATSRDGPVQYQPGDSFTTDKDVTLYAIWEAENLVSLTLSNDSFTVKPGEQVTLNFTFTGNISDVGYEIKNTSICEYVDGEWKQSQHRGALTFRALSSGTTDITIELFDKTGKVLDSQSASFIVETPQNNASIELSEANINFSSPGETQEIRAITTPSGQEITWSKKIIETLPIPDRNPSAFTMRNTGGEINRIRATEAGIAEVIASMTYAGNTYTASCTVMTPGIYVFALDTTVVKDGDRKIMNIGATEQFSVYTIPLNRAVRWDSSDPSVATVSNNGAVTAVGSGFAEIRATIDVNGTTYSDSCYVAVPENSSNTGIVYFDTLYPFASDRYTGNEGDSFIDVIGRRNGNVDVNGNSYEHGLTAWIARWNYTAESSWVWNQYSLGRNYKTLTGKVVLIKSYNESNFDTQLTITGDGIPLYSKRLTPDSLPTEEFQINVAGINTLKIELSDNTSVRGGTAFGLANLSLQ